MKTHKLKQTVSWLTYKLILSVVITPAFNQVFIILISRRRVTATGCSARLPRWSTV